MDELNYIGQLFRDGLKGHTIEPSDKVWANIQKNIGSSPTVKPNSKFTKYIISGAAVVSLIVATVAIAYYSNNNSVTTQNNSVIEKPTLANNTTPNVVEPQVINTPQSTKNTPAQIVKETPKQTQPKTNSQTTVNNTVIDNLSLQNPPITTISYSNYTDKTQPQLTSDQTNKEIPLVVNPKDVTPKPEPNSTPKTNITLDITSDTSVCIGEAITIKAKGGTSILWSTGATTDEITITALNEEQDYTYRAVIQTLTGDTSIAIHVKAIICQPNAFTPNGDGVHDLFIPHINGEFSDYTLMIYSRNGVKVFESKVIEQGWDGKYNNEEMKEGAYFYILRYRDKNGSLKNIRGSVVLIRP
jgi:gliding motility-associated-like protein